MPQLKSTFTYRELKLYTCFCTKKKAIYLLTFFLIKVYGSQIYKKKYLFVLHKVYKDLITVFENNKFDKNNY